MAGQSSNADVKRGESSGPENYRILVIGKTGNGKSSICNAILGEEKFQTGRSMSSTTTAVQEAVATRNDKQIKVVDTPDVTNLEEMRSSEKQEEISKWQKLTSPFPSAILLAVRCDVRYTAEEYDIYQQIKFYWGDNNFCDRLVVVFTFGDRQDNPIDEELKIVCKELQNVLRDAGNRYVVFDKTKSGNDMILWSSLLGHINEIEDRTTEKPPPSPLPSNRTRHVVFLLAVLVVLFVILCIVFFVLHIKGAGIAFGVIALVVLLVLAAIIYWKRNSFC